MGLLSTVAVTAYLIQYLLLNFFRGQQNYQWAKGGRRRLAVINGQKPRV